MFYSLNVAIDFDPYNKVAELDEKNNSYNLSFNINASSQEEVDITPPINPEDTSKNKIDPGQNQQNQGDLVVPKAKIDNKLSNRLRGKLLLQVQNRGRIWYVNPGDANRHEVTFANALPLFQKFALGINNTDLNKIPLHGQNSTSATGNRLKGKLLLQVQDRGRIWYIDFDGKRWEVTWANLMTLFESLALGITNNDLSKISAGSL